MASVIPPNPLPPDENVGPVLLGVSGACLALVIITTSVRIWVRSALRSSGWDDYTIVIVTLLGIARFGVQVGQVNIGNGRHRWYISEENYMRNNMLGWVAQILLFASICLLKVSILLLLLRIKDSQRVKYSAWAIMAGLVVTNFGCIIILLSECRPVSAYWTGVGNCWDPRVRIYYIYATIAFSILTDMICSMLPVFVIWNTSLPLKTKISVWALMSLGLIATGFGIARAASLGITTSDLSWVYAITAIWSNLELYLGIVAANLALSRSIFGYFFRGTEATRGSSYGKPRSISTSKNLRLPNSNNFRSGQGPEGHGSEISLVQTTKKQPSTWLADSASSTLALNSSKALLARFKEYLRPMMHAKPKAWKARMHAHDTRKSGPYWFILVPLSWTGIQQKELLAVDVPLLPCSIWTVPVSTFCAAYLRIIMQEEAGSMARVTAIADLSGVLVYSMFDMSYEGSYMLTPEDEDLLDEGERERMAEKDALEMENALSSIQKWEFTEQNEWARDVILKLVSGKLMYADLPVKGKEEVLNG
ncbi:hypothetical protein F53441_10513 [Fusarium austroafricanum]|uniref:Rhodopsin domain-containing protein n=1 Tax=Fusarium austroafricanum TaxID=2364996 RepID=A0A8H4KB48_9HYPO|nr:hypothetical protein F53441_10513 [Fusarium austroafricanum]